MGKVAFVFAGQGAQYSGMGEELSQVSVAAVNIFSELDIMRPGTSSQCFFGNEEELSVTKNTQPCIFAVEMAAAAVLSENGIFADAVAGFSLGEVAALTYAKVLDLETGFRLVCVRGELMQKAAEMQQTAMAAVLRLSEDDVRRICSCFSGVYPVNFNCPGQISVACPENEMANLCAEVKAAGGRALPLKVKGGFHSPYMSSASHEFAAELEKFSFSSPSVTLYSNCTGNPYPCDEKSIKELLAKQICSPVYWEKIIRNMITDGFDTFIELGPGHTLSGMIEKTDKSVRCFGLSNRCDLETILSEVI